MKKLLKILGCCAAAAVLLMLAATLAIKIFFPPEKLKAMAMTFLTNQFRREFRMDSVSAGLGGVTVNGFAVSESGGFAKGSMLEAKNIGVSFKLAALLRKEILVSSVNFDGIKLNIEKHRDGTFNFSDMMPQPSTAAAQASQVTAPSVPAAQHSSSPSYNFEADRISLANASLAYKDETGAQTQIEKLSFSAKNVTLSKPFAMSGEFDLVYPFMGHKLPLHVKAAATVDATAKDISGYGAKITDFSATWGKATFTAAGDVKNFAAPQGSAQCKISSFDSAQLAGLFPQMPKGIMLPQATAQASFKMDNASFALNDIKAQAGPASVNGSFKMDFGKTPVWLFNGEAKASVPAVDTSELAKLSPAVPAGYHLPAAEMSAKFSVTQNRADVPSWEIKAGSLNAKGSASAAQAKDGWMAQALASYINMSLSDINKMAPEYAKYAPTGIVSGQVKVVYAPKAPLTYGGSLALSRVGAAYEKSTVSDINATVQLAGTNAKIEKLSGKLNGADFSGSFSLSMDPKLIKTQATLAFTTLDLGPLMPPTSTAAASAANGTATSAQAKSGKATAAALPPLDAQISVTAAKITHPNFNGQNAQFSCDLNNITPALDKLGGKASFSVKNGQFRDLSSLANNNKYAKLLFLPLVQMQKAVGGAKLGFLPDLNNIAYSVIDGAYNFRNGLMTIEKSDLDSSAGQVTAAGSVNLPAQQCDMQVKIKPAGNLGKYGQPVILVKGPVMSPSIKVDAKSLVTDEVKQKAVDMGKKLLQGLFK
jgi:hypothetical protein